MTLEIRCAVKRTEGSNPSLSANKNPEAGFSGFFV